VSSAAADLASRSFRGRWRQYQQRALDAFDRDVTLGDRSFYLVLPPGAGKTIVGLEAARRLGRRTLVLAPNNAVQGQWAAAWDGNFGDHGPRCSVDRGLDAPVTVLTYQSIAVIDRGTTAAQRRAVMRDGDRQALLDLLHPNGRGVVERAASIGPWTLVLDECHHLLATWGALVRAVAETLGRDTALIGLTATPPRALTGWQRALHDELFGSTDFDIQAPALVKEGDLAPYRELVYLTRPTADEDTWLASEASRFADLQVQLVDKRLGSVPLVEWLERRVVDRALGDGVRLGWDAFEQAEPALARAALRFARTGMIPVPEGARVREQHRTAPDADDWVTVLSDFCQHHLLASDDPADVDALAAIRRVLPGLGYQFTRQGIRTHVSPVDRLCGLSEAKVAGAVHILSEEFRELGTRLRALVLCDFEQQAARLPAGLSSSPLDQRSGSARLAFETIAHADVGGRTGGLRPLMVTGQVFACPTSMADELTAYCAAAGFPVSAAPLDGVPGGSRIVWPADVSSRVWVRIATAFFTEGRAHVLVGTRALLGEGWDCPAVNVNVDLTTAATATAVTQMRGRSLRLDPNDPAKVADNWTVCCVADQHPRGGADYDRLVRKHEAHFALTVDGQIESGVTHCDPALSPYAPPSREDAVAITARALEQPYLRADAREAWRIGEPAEGVELTTVRVRSARPLGHSTRVLSRALGTPPVPGRREPRRRARLFAWHLTEATAVVTGTTMAAGPAVGAAAAAVALGVFGVLVGRRAAAAGPAPGPVEQLAAVVADALHTSGKAAAGADAVRVVPTVDGWLRCELTGVPVEESERFATALDELLAPLAAPRFLVGRRVVPAPATRRGRLVQATRVLLGLPIEGAVAWHAVPRVFQRGNDPVEAFRSAWEHWIGPVDILSADMPSGQAVLTLFRGEDPFAVTTQLRTLWR
jgi:superfamily II DNA or RNA helicase